jgi:hypothetical protein
MIDFKQLMERAGGQSAGTLELHSTSPEKAISYAEKEFKKAGMDLSKDIPLFEQNLAVAKQHATTGKLKRKDMPVICSSDLAGLEKALKERKVRTTKGKMNITSMKPSQYQIYIDKALKGIIKNGVAKTRKFLTSGTFFILSSDDYIMEGHHRFLTGILFDPTMQSKYFKVDMNRDQLLKFLKSHSESLGNTCNEEKE